MRVFCALWESEPRVQQCGSPIGNLCHRHMCAIHRRVHASWLNPHHCYRFSADLTLTRHVLLRPTLMKLSLWRFIRAQSACYRPLGRSCDEWTWRWTLMTTPCSRLPYFAVSSEDSYLHPWWRSHEEWTLEVNFGEDSSLLLTQLLHHLVK